MCSVKCVIREWNQNFPETLNGSDRETILLHARFEWDVLLIENLLILLSHRFTE